jgi:hypothetical protein
MNHISIPKPTIDWQTQLNEGSDFFTQEAIIESDKLLDRYVASLQDATNENAIWRANGTGRSGRIYSKSRRSGWPVLRW